MPTNKRKPTRQEVADDIGTYDPMRPGVISNAGIDEAAEVQAEPELTAPVQAVAVLAAYIEQLADDMHNRPGAYMYADDTALNGIVNSRTFLLALAAEFNVMWPIIQDFAKWGVGGLMPVRHVATAQRLVADRQRGEAMAEEEGF